MGMATTILLNKAFITRDDDAIARSLSHSIFTSLAFGCWLGCLQYTFARPAVRALAGSSLEVIPFALVYSRIRSFAAVFALPTIVIQSAYLTWKDAKTPLEAVLFGALFNLVGDVLLVSVYKMGITGAAIATLLSQIAGFLYLVFIGIQRISSAKQRPIHDTTYYRTLIKVPTPAESLGFISFAGPLFFILIIKTLLWTFTTYASSKSGTFQLAAHQLILNFFLLFCIFGDVISQLSQTFLPPYLQRYMKIIETKDINTISSHDSPDLVTPLKTTIRRIFSIALVVGSTNTLLSIILSRFTPQVSTSTF
jgi:Na+-driven multidrug efflux pump